MTPRLAPTRAELLLELADKKAGRQVRQMAATVVALADEPDPRMADVESLAGYLAEAGFGPDATPETVAVAALRWMRNREARS